MTLESQVVHGLKWQAINIAGKQLVSLVVITTLTRHLDPKSFGLFGLVSIYIGYASLLAEQGIGAALIQRSNVDPKHWDTAFWFNLGCAILLCAITMALAGPVSLLMGEPQLARLLQWSSISLPITALSSIHNTIFIKKMDFRRPAIRMLIANTFGGVIAVAMALAGFGVWTLIAQQLAVSIGGTLFLWIVSPYRPSFFFSLRYLSQLMAVSSSTFLATLIHSVSSKFDQIFIGRFAGAPMLGLYVIAGKIPEIAKSVTFSPIAQVALPALSRLQNDYPRLRQAIYDGMEINAIICFPVYFGIAAVASDLLPVVFGPQWASGGTLCSLLSIYMLLISLSAFIYPTLLATGGAGRYVILNVFQAIGMLASCIAGVYLGVNVLVSCLIASGILMRIPTLYFLRQRVDLDPRKYLRPCIIPFSASLVMIGSILFLSRILPASWPLLASLICKIILGATIYISLMFLFNRSKMIYIVDIVLHTLGLSSNKRTGNT